MNMAEFTPNYRLHQWEPTDPFLREDFNADLSAVDTALGRLTRSAEDSAYNLYNLMLQNDYEGKYTGYKKALMFDGFTDESGIAEKSESILQTNEGLLLSGTGQGNVSTTTKSGTVLVSGTVYSDTFQADGVGYLEKITFSGYYLEDPGDDTLDTSLTIYVNDQVAAQKSFLASSTTHYTITLDTPVPIVPGDRFFLTLAAPSNTWFRLYRSAADEKHAAVTFEFRSAASESGSIQTVPCILDSAASKARLYVRSSGGSVVPELNGVQLELVEESEADSLQGMSCTERCWIATGSWEEVVLTFRISRNDVEDCRFFDYGLILL